MRGECERQIFFPSASSNLVCALLFRWECFVFSLLTSGVTRALELLLRRLTTGA